MEAAGRIVRDYEFILRACFRQLDVAGTLETIQGLEQHVLALKAAMRQEGAQCRQRLVAPVAVSLQIGEELLLLIQRRECLRKEIRRAECPNLDAGSLVFDLDLSATSRIELGLPYPDPQHPRFR